MEDTSQPPDSALDESFMSHGEAIPHTQYPPNTHGWVNHRLTSLQASEERPDAGPAWNLRWLAVEVKSMNVRANICEVCAACSGWVQSIVILTIHFFSAPH